VARALELLAGSDEPLREQLAGFLGECCDEGYLASDEGECVHWCTQQGHKLQRRVVVLAPKVAFESAYDGL
jgi:hypothetical protein